MQVINLADTTYYNYSTWEKNCIDFFSASFSKTEVHSLGCSMKAWRCIPRVGEAKLCGAENQIECSNHTLGIHLHS